MTIEQLLECSADVLEKMSDAELLQHFQQYLDVTRPDRARKKQTQPRQEAVYVSPGKKRALNALAEMGIDLDLFKRKKKK